MFEQFSSNKGKEPLSGPLKFLTIGACGLLLSLGLCGAGALFHRGANPEDFGILSFLGFLLFGLSILTLVVGVLVLVFTALVNFFRR